MTFISKAQEARSRYVPSFEYVPSFDSIVNILLIYLPTEFSLSVKFIFRLWCGFFVQLVYTYFHIAYFICYLPCNNTIFTI